ncbi:hypothetical protein P154DRAFT_577812 [Amniculicola lignicola CBS 123094]|uniref:Uncharacterized protein n=1 Tax=Amniculicola lignicola CBS 123094 TaxID=1392246 RepID=A0A6A5WLE5_9PLEO|nr:hypothetical protein P154DRAFT_577812 [Amniculicola lignicola CBS 123094]
MALIGTMLKGCMLYPLGSSFGQLRFYRFSKRWHKLNEMDIINEAGRGTVGSLQLLFHFGKRCHFLSIYTFCAVLTVLAFFTDYFVQNAVEIQHSLRKQRLEAQYPRTDRYVTFNYAYNRTEDEVKLGSQFAGIDMLGAINLGMAASTTLWSKDEFGRAPVICLTGNCTFPTHQALALGKKCVNTTSFIDHGDETFYRSRDGLVLHRALGMVNTSASPVYPENDNMIPPLLIRISMIGSMEPNVTLPIAMECSLFWFVMTETLNVTNNKILYNEKIRQPTSYYDYSVEGRTTYNQNKNITLQPPECWKNGKKVQGPCPFFVDARAQLGLQNMFMNPQVGFTGTIIRGPNHSWQTSNTFAGTIGVILYNVLNSAPEDKMDPYVAIEALFHWIRLAMNSAISATERDMSRKKDALQREWTQGTTWEMEAYYKAKLYWLTPVHLMIICSYLAFKVAKRSARGAVSWKTSLLPLLYHGFATESRAGLPEARTFAMMEENAKAVEAKFEMTGEGLRLMTRNVSGQA